MAEKEKKVKAETTEENALVTENEQLKEELEKAKAQADEYKDKWMRNVAEFDNYKKRNAKLWTDANNEGKSSVILKILPVGDHLDMAISLGLDEKSLKGIELIKRKFNETLEEMGVTEINPLGEIFNPEIAEAIMQVQAQDGEAEDTVKQVFQKGYKMGDKIIRYAKVSVAK